MVGQGSELSKVTAPCLVRVSVGSAEAIYYVDL